MAAAYLESLNPEQRRAVEHGAAGGSAASPLLVIAGAGSGKTNTLAHRVAHLIVQGADPRRILLMTFSRRAASEMIKRVERIARKVLGDNAGIMTDALTWAGTYHGIGARLLREYAEQIGLDPTFTIHDREDSADLMNFVRHEKGFSKTESRFPTKGTCLSIYSRCVNAEMPIEQVIGASYPWCSGWPTARNRSARSVTPLCATSSTFRISFRRRRTSSRSIAITARRSRFSPPPTASSASPRNASPKTSGPSAPLKQSRNSSRSATRPT